MRSVTSELALVICVVAVIAVSTSEVNADPGDFDQSFGAWGVTVDNDFVYDMYPKRLVQQSDGKLLVAGHYQTSSSSTARVLLRRYNSNGTVDTSFGLSGFAVTQIFNPSVVAVYGVGQDILVQSDGKIVIVGSNSSGATVWRFTALGELDTTFSGDGIATVQTAVPIYTKIVSYQGKYIVATFDASANARLRRLNSNGSIDNTFGTFGQTTITLGTNFLPIVINPTNGKFAIGGSVGSVPALQHFNSTGTYDTSFGPSGLRTVSLATNCNGYTMTPHWIHSIARQSDGKLIAGAGVDWPGGCAIDSCYGNAVVRLNSDDTLDTGYGSGGFASKCDGRMGGPEVKLATNGSNSSLVKYGSVNFGSTFNDNIRFRRYTSTGILSLLLFDENPWDFLAQQADGKIVTMSRTNVGDIRLARFLP